MMMLHSENCANCARLVRVT